MDDLSHLLRQATLIVSGCDNHPIRPPTWEPGVLFTIRTRNLIYR